MRKSQEKITISPEQMMKLAIIAKLSQSGVRLGTDIEAMFEIQDMLESLLFRRRDFTPQFRDFLVINKNRIDKQIIARLAKKI